MQYELQHNMPFVPFIRAGKRRTVTPSYRHTVIPSYSHTIIGTVLRLVLRLWTMNCEHGYGRNDNGLESSGQQTFPCN
jgi:hypothetical protein